MAKVYLSPSNQTDNRYAYGNTTEAVQCGKIADACRIALERSGVTVKVGHMPSMQDSARSPTPSAQTSMCPSTPTPLTVRSAALACSALTAAARA